MDPILEALKEFQDSLGALARDCAELADELAEQREHVGDWRADEGKAA